ncbi:hypothetical protein DZK27_13620 [Rhodobacteraceae bacterium 63075]|nr:hypothetical protein DZK27_13620 [Rhodobacteraceae bacterium 63075]
MSREVFIHAGAHRTGTSSFQLCMAANRERLEAEGFDLSYPSRDGVPGGTLALRLPKPRHGPEDVADFTEKMSRIMRGQVTEGRGKLLFSDENLPGIIRLFFNGKLYPNARKRYMVMRDAFAAIEARPRRALFVVRPYAELFVSGYRKHAEDNAIEPFAELAGTMAGFKGGWPNAVRAMQNVLGPEEIRVIEYGARGQSRDLLGQLLGRDPSDFIEPERQMNISATDAAMLALQEIHASGRTLRRAEWQQIIRSHAGNDEDLGFARFSEAQKAALDARYAEDLEALRQMDGVTLVE